MVANAKFRAIKHAIVSFVVFATLSTVAATLVIWLTGKQRHLLRDVEFED